MEDHHAKPEDLSPFERLREFARRIVAAPQAEINKKMAEYQREKGQKNKKGLRNFLRGR
jgi:hypothetical protein